MAARYWVGGTGNWSDNTNHWSDADGGSPGASKPTSSDAVYFNANSGSGTCTINETASCASFDMSSSALATIAGSSGLTVAGSLTVVSGGTWSHTGAITFTGTGTFTTNGVTISGNNNITVGTAGITVTLGDNFTGSNRPWVLSSGTLDFNEKTVTCNNVTISGTATRTFDISNCTINCAGWNATAVTNLTFTVTGSTINATGVSQILNNLTYNIWNDNSAGTGTTIVTGTPTFATYTITGPATKSHAHTYNGNITVTGTFTCNGNSATNREWLRSDTWGTARTITAATVSITNVDFTDITGAGAGTWSGTSIGDAGGNSGITFTTATTCTWTGNGGNWSTAAEWDTGTVPLCHDTVVFNASSVTSGSQTITQDMPRPGKDITFSSIANSPTLAWTTSCYITGSLTLDAGIGTFNPASTTTVFIGRGTTNTLTTAGKSFNAITIASPSGKYTLQDNLTCISTCAVSNGEFDANDNNVNASSLYLVYTTTRIVRMGNSTWTLSGARPIDQDWLYTGVTFYAEGSTVVFNGTSQQVYLYGSAANATLNNIVKSGGGSLTIYYNFTCNNFEIDDSAGATTLTHGGFTCTSLDWVGTSGNGITLGSKTVGTHFTITDTAGTNNFSYLTITDTNATGGALFQLDGTCTITDASTGWTLLSLYTFNKVGYTWNEVAYTLND